MKYAEPSCKVPFDQSRMTKLGLLDDVGTGERAAIRSPAWTKLGVPQRLTRLLKHLDATHEAILRSTTLDEMLQSTADAGVEVAGFLSTAIFRKRQNPSSLWYLDAAAGSLLPLLPTIRIDADLSALIDETLAGFVRKSSALCVIKDLSRDPRTGNWSSVAKDAGIRSCVALPICVGSDTVGVMCFFLGEVLNRLDGKLCELMERIAEAVSFGLAISDWKDRHHLAMEEQAQITRMYVALCATNEAIMRASTRTELLHRVCEAAVLGGNFTSTTVALVETDQEFLRVAASMGPNADRVKTTRFSICATHPEGRGLTGTAFRTRQPCIINDFLHDGRTSYWHNLPAGGGTKSGASFPLLKGNTCIGVLIFLSSELDTFTPQLVGLLARLAENVSFAFGNFQRQDEKDQADHRIRHLATHDPLTGLVNRAAFEELLDSAMKSAHRNQRKCALLSLHIDRFKVINDSLGHAAGDALLIEIARRLVGCLRQSDVVARCGDEFVIILNDVTDHQQVTEVAVKILSEISGAMKLGDHECQTTGSVGIAVFPEHGEDNITLSKNADAAMYSAKMEAKGCYRLYSSDIQSQSIDKLNMETDLRHALELDQFTLNYQPKIDAVTHQITGVEALLRWKHPDLGMLPPDKFIPLAEDTGLIVSIGRWVMLTACTQNVAWQRQGLAPISMAVNLSPRQFLDEKLLSDIDGILAATEMSPRLLQLEITESMVMQNVERAIEIANAIQSRGIRLAIDDFGTGYSSMSLMKKFPIDTIKIDRSFVRDLAANYKDRAIIIAIIAMAKSLRLTVVAEGVETPEQEQFLCAHLCDELQGFLFSRAVPADTIPRLLLQFAVSPSLQPQIVAGWLQEV